MDNITAHQLAVFEQKPIRQTQYNGETYFSVVDIIEILSDAPIPRNYWSDLKRREKQLHELCVQLKLAASDGKMRSTDCANTEGVLRIIQSVPSPKAEPFKMWLAGLGKREIEENIDPELSFERLRDRYRAKGYSEEWIGYRLKSVEIRKELTEEWQKRGVQEGQEYSILTATIAQQTFGLTPSQHADLKGLKKENLRDHMSNLELIFTALGEEATRALAEKRDAQGFEDNREVAVDGGNYAGNARRNFEELTDKKVVTAASPLKELEKGKKD